MNASNAYALSPPSPNTSLTIVGASSTLGKLIIPDIPKLLPHYKSITLVTGPTNKSFPDLKKLLPSATLQTYTEFESSSARCPNTDCLFITPPSSFASYSSTLTSLLPKFPPPSTITLISSAGVYGNLSGPVTSLTPLSSTPTPRQSNLQSGESAILSHPNGYIIRLAGLWTSTRGPHRYWVENGSVKGDPSGGVNLLHYSDAATAVIKCLSNLRTYDGEERVVLVSDGQGTVSRKNICEVTVKSRKWKGKRVMPEFVGGETKRGRPEKEPERVYIPSGELLEGWEGGRSFEDGMS
ncbi:hypothetical protein TrVE_jg11971 [Triparma verrucosa]|uniref:NAD(P)-binding protein n=1 Tax=Triparma verrucosa TaxID=1606542 RepID=A0A9W7F3R9_9STRA|nr:hypothetical protein TrVE_jg11971 [Triparma verrucosa]